MKENLPYPFVFYPEFNGSFIGFKKTKKGKIYFCECNKKAIRNFMEFKLSDDTLKPSDDLMFFLFDSINFPIELTKRLIRKKIEQDKNIIKYLNFKENLCHLCNRQFPKTINTNRRDFYNQFLIYINMLSYKYGIRWFPWEVIEKECPEKLLELIEVDRNQVWQKVRELNSDSEELLKLDKRTRNKIEELMDPVFRQENKVRGYIENEIRRKYGLKDVGDYWTNETKLFNIIEKFFPNMKVERHFRPYYLKGLELDIFIEDLKLGLEYQGKQHFEPVKHWGGKKAHAELKKRDTKKKKLCKSLGISILYFKHSEIISADLVKNKISKLNKEYSPRN